MKNLENSMHYISLPNKTTGHSIPVMVNAKKHWYATHEWEFVIVNMINLN